MTEHETVPVLLVMPVQVWVALSWRVTGSLEIGAEVFELVSTPETVVANPNSPVAECTVSVVGSGGGGLTATFEAAEEAR